jgi:hypothetical protein
MDELTAAFPADAPQEIRFLQLSIVSNPLISALFGSYLARRMEAAATSEKRSRCALLKQNVFDPTTVTSTFVPPPAPPTAPDADPTEKKLHPGLSFAALSGTAAVTAASTGSSPTAPLRSALAVEPGWSIQNPFLCHLFILDAAGRVRWRAVGPPLMDDVSRAQRLDDISIARRLLEELRQEQREGKGDSVLKAARRTPPSVQRAVANAHLSAVANSGTSAASGLSSKAAQGRVTVTPPRGGRGE